MEQLNGQRNAKRRAVVRLARGDIVADSLRESELSTRGASRLLYPGDTRIPARTLAPTPAGGYHGSSHPPSPETPAMSLERYPGCCGITRRGFLVGSAVG